jgi:seryl-tRNA synthetase
MCAKEIGSKMKRKEPIGDDDTISQEIMDKLQAQALTSEDLKALTVKQIKKLQNEVDKLNQSCTAQLKECELQRHAYLTQIGNILHPSVPISATEDDNTVERTSGDCSTRKRYSHIDLLHMIDAVETQKATVAAGNRCYYLKGVGVFLEQALIQCAMRILHAKGYTPIYTPFFMKKEVMQEVAQLSDFDEMLYKVCSSLLSAL